jgi:hypothetical protein
MEDRGVIMRFYYVETLERISTEITHCAWRALGMTGQEVNFP